MKVACAQKNVQFFLVFLFCLIFNNFFFRIRSRSMPFFGCSACLTVCYQENKEVTRPLSQGWARNFRLKTLAENNWMFGPKYCNLELRRRTIFPVPCALLKLAALLLSCLTHIQIGVFFNWKKKNGLLLLKIYDKGNSGHARKPSSLTLKQRQSLRKILLPQT